MNRKFDEIGNFLPLILYPLPRYTAHRGKDLKQIAFGIVWVWRR